MDPNTIVPQVGNVNQMPQPPVIPVQSEPEVKKNSPIFVIALIILLIAIIALVGYIIYTKYFMEG